MTITFKNELSLKDYDSVSLAEILRAHFVATYPVANTARLNDAIQVASYLHRTDVRRGARGKSINPPYIEHPLRVAIRLFRYFDVKNPDTLIAAILHDTVEDHAPEFGDFEGGTNYRDKPEVARQAALEFISDNFGYAVASIVEDVSNPIPEGTPTKEEKIAAYQEHVSRISYGGGAGIILKFSDFVDNAGSLHHHYEYDDKSAQYFVKRYAGLIPIYRDTFKRASHKSVQLYDAEAALSRLAAVSAQFEQFKQGA